MMLEKCELIPHDVFVRLRTVLAFVGRQQDLSIERLDTNEHLEATGLG